MRKEGFRGVFSSRDARVNILLFASILVIFALTVVFVEAMTIQIVSPGNFTFNSSNRNINITFNVTWSNSFENITNCTLYVNSTTSQIAWAQQKVVDIAKNGTALQKDDRIHNFTALSYMNFTFSNDGNFTWAVGCYNNNKSSSLNFSTSIDNANGYNFSLFLDASPPVVNFSASFRDLFNTSTVAAREIRFAINDSVYGVSESAYGLNMSRNLSINLSIYNLGGEKLAFFSYVNDSSVTNLTCTATDPAITKGSVICNATYTFNGNDTFLVNVSAIDAADSFRTASNFNTSAIRITVDQIPPVIVRLNFSSNSSALDPLGSQTPSTVPADGRGTWAQGRRLLGLVNVTDNLTAPIHAYLQFYNLTSSTWTTVNSTMDGGLNITPSATNANGTANLTYNVPTGHNLFEGANISFRYLVNDTVGNVNTSSEVVNVTIQINDTTKPTIEVRVGSESGTLNFTNTTDTTPTIFWNVTDRLLRYIAVQIDGSTSALCNKFANYTQADDLAEANKNGSITVSSSGTCPLSNGTRVVRLTAEDTWGNSELYIHSIIVDTGGPNITFNNTQHGIAPVLTGTNVTPYTGINITVVGIGQAAIKNMTWTSSCNSSSNVFTNGTFIYPFQNISSCANSQANRTVTILAYDVVGNSQTKTLTLTVDDLGPSLAVLSPAHRSNNTNNVTITLSAQDGSQSIAFFGYFIDNKIENGGLTNTGFYANSGTLNISSAGALWISATGANATNTFKLNFTPGTHKIKFTVNDTLGNARNSSIMTFDVRGIIDLRAIGLNVTNKTGNSFAQYHYANALNATIINLTNSSGITVDELLNVSGRTLNLFIALSNTSKRINVSILFNESAAVWDRYNFSIKQNDTTTMDFLTNNWTTAINDYILVNETIQEFLPDNESYYVSVDYPINASSADIGGAFEIWYFDDAKDFATITKKKNVTKCADGFAPSLTFDRDSTCWNHTTNQTISVLLPHFSV